MAEDNINHPKHYELDKIECIDAMEMTQGRAAVMSFCLCNAFKYIWRHRRKNHIEDIRKAKWYIDKYIELYNKDEKENKRRTLENLTYNCVAPKELRDKFVDACLKDAAQVKPIAKESDKLVHLKYGKNAGTYTVDEYHKMKFNEPTEEELRDILRAKEDETNE